MIIFANLEGTIWNSPKIYIIISSSIVTLFAFKKNIKGLSNISFLGNFAVTIFMICVVILFFVKLISGKINTLSKELFFHSFSFKDSYVVFSSLLEGLLYQMVTFSVYCSLKERNNKNMIKVCSYGSSLVVLIYATIGILCFLMYGNNTTESVFGMFRSELIAVKGKNNFIVFLLLLSLSCLLFNATLSFPVQFFVIKNSVFHLLGIIKQCNYPNPEVLVELEDLNNNQIEEVKEAKELTEEEKEEKLKEVYGTPELTKIILTFVMLILITLSSISVEQLISICNVVGATCGNLIVLICPGAFVVILTRTNWLSIKKLLPKFMVILGTVILGLYFKYEFFGQQKENIASIVPKYSENEGFYDLTKVPKFSIIYGDNDDYERKMAFELQKEAKEKFGIDSNVSCMKGIKLHEIFDHSKFVVFIVSDSDKGNNGMGYDEFYKNFSTFSFFNGIKNDHLVYTLFNIEKKAENKVDNLKIIDERMMKANFMKVCDIGISKDENNNVEKDFNNWKNNFFWPKVISYFNINNDIYQNKKK